MKTVIFSLLFTLTISAQAQEINWVSIEEAYALSLKNPKPILIDVYTDWCGWCKKMDKSTYANKGVIEYLNKNYYAVKFNAEQKDSVVIGEQVFKFVAQGRRGYHEFAVALLEGKLSYPTTVFFDSNFQLTQRIPGYLDVTTLEPILIFLGTDVYKTTPWEKFKEDFQHSF